MQVQRLQVSTDVQWGLVMALGEIQLLSDKKAGVLREKRVSRDIDEQSDDNWRAPYSTIEEPSFESWLQMHLAQR